MNQEELVICAQARDCDKTVMAIWRIIGYSQPVFGNSLISVSDFVDLLTASAGG
ncbi:MAG TPA: hypothetical protein PLB97_01870 [Accumulibacter sp.]|nr:hypothetical protein [Accumulibacter sp.]HPP47373.1 hypothetical protein [Accumulibacter sp.]